jgi:hypothetical protein
MGAVPDYAVVVPTAGRPTLQRLLSSLEEAGASPERIVVADDRRSPSAPLFPSGAPHGVVVVNGDGVGPAAARNLGAAAAGETSWIVFLDDDVEVTAAWAARLHRELAAMPSRVACVHGRVEVPLPRDHPPTAGERGIADRAAARWRAADLAVRRDAFAAVDGFDPCLRGTLRPDGDFALRLASTSWVLVYGERTSLRRLGAGNRWRSLSALRNLADEALMRARHGPRFRATLGEPRSALPGYLATCVAGLAALCFAGRRRALAACAAGAWLASTLAPVSRQLIRAPRRLPDVAKLVAVGIATPPLGVIWSIVGTWRLGAARLAGRCQRSLGPRRTPPAGTGWRRVEGIRAVHRLSSPSAAPLSSSWGGPATSRVMTTARSAPASGPTT